MRGGSPGRRACPERPGCADRRRLPRAAAGTGAESSSTAIFAGPQGRKRWIWGQAIKADRIVLDPALTFTKPAALTARVPGEAATEGSGA
ncbi:MAG: iron-containing alcohol dehydrogenase [Pikeienuella sp.]